MDRLIQMIINAVLRQVINRGVKTGIDRLSGGGKPRSAMTQDEVQQARTNRTPSARPVRPPIWPGVWAADPATKVKVRLTKISNHMI